MSKTLQFRRGTTSQLSTISGAIGELFVDTTKDTVVVMDGSTAGGFPLASEALLASVQSSLQSSFNQGLEAKQNTLVSGSNIKTVNGQSVLGSGNLVITGDGGVLDTSTFATKTDLLILDSDDIDEGLTNQYYTNQKVANVLLNGNHTNISFAYDGSALSASVSLPPTPPASGDTFDTLNIQQEEVVIGTVTSKSIVPPTTEFTEYVGTQSGQQSQEELYSVLKFDYGYFYSNYANIYSPSDNTKTKEFFAAGNTVRITKDGYWWDLQMTSASGGDSTYFSPNYIVIGTNSTWDWPSQYDSYYQWNQNISFSTNLPIAQRYALTLSNPAIALGASDKLLFNGAVGDPTFNLNVTDRGTWDNGIAGGNENGLDVIFFGANSYNTNQDQIKELLQVGVTITLRDSVWGQNAIYLVTSVGADTNWGSTYGFSVKLQHVSGVNYSQQYAPVHTVFNNYFLSVSGIVPPNYTSKYRSTHFSALNNTSYVSFNNYDFINVGDEVSYIPGIASIQFKDDAGNNVKAISYNNLTGAITYDGLVQTLEYNSTLSNLWSINASSNRKNTNIDSSHANLIAIGKNAESHAESIAIGKNATINGPYAVSIGNNTTSIGQSTTIGYNNYATNYATALGTSTNAYGQESIAIGYACTTSGPWSVAIGASARADSRAQYSYASSGSSFCRNQTTIIQWSTPDLSLSGNRYLHLGNTGSTSSSPATWMNGAFALSNLSGRSDCTVALGIATVMYKPTNDQNNDDVKVEEIKFIVRTTTSQNWVIDTLSTTSIYSGSGSLHPNWSTSFEISNSNGNFNHLYCKINKGSDTTSIGISVKVEFQVLSTNN